MRRSDHDVSDSIRTTDPRAVAKEVARLFKALYDAPTGGAIEQAFDDIVSGRGDR